MFNRGRANTYDSSSSDTENTHICLVIYTVIMLELSFYNSSGVQACVGALVRVCMCECVCVWPECKNKYRRS